MDTENYLPDQFTVEFDGMYENDMDHFAYTNDFFVRFYNGSDQNYTGYGLYKFMIHSNTQTLLGVHSYQATNTMPESLKNTVQSNDAWHHIAIYVRKNIGKVYLNQYRVSASNTLPISAAKLAIATDGNYGFKIKNFRLAA